MHDCTIPHRRVTRLIRSFPVLLAAVLFIHGPALLHCGGSVAFAQAITSQPVPNPTHALGQLADQFDKTPNTVVADVNGTPITLGMVADHLRDFPIQMGALPSTVVYREALDQLIQQRALVVKARELGLENDPIVQRRISEATDHGLAGAVIEHFLPRLVTEQAIKQRYDATIAGKPGPEEVRFQVIATETEAAANEVLADLRRGADFATLVRDSSVDPSKADGGEIGYTRRDLLTPEMGAVVFALAPGQTTAYPVRSNGLWFVIRVEGRQQQAAPSLDAVRDQISASLTRQAQVEIARQARATVVVKEYGMTGTQGRDAAGGTKTH